MTISIDGTNESREVERAEKHIALMNSDYQERDIALQNKQNEHRLHNFSEDEVQRLQAERDQLSRIYDSALRNARQRLDLAKAKLDSKKKLMDEEGKQKIEVMKKAAKAIFLSRGFNEADFEKAWPGILEQQKLAIGSSAIEPHQQVRRRAPTL